MLLSKITRKFRALSPVVSSSKKVRQTAMFEGLEDRKLMSAYFVSATGNDANNGLSSTSAFRTISKLNSMTFRAGDKISFEGGKTFYGNLKFTDAEIATSANPITVTSYGTGKAIINGGTGSSIELWKTGGYKINNLKLVGSGSSNTGAGILATNPKSAGIDFDGLNFDYIEATGFADGIRIRGINGTAGYNNVRITNGKFYENSHAGVMSSSPSNIAHRNFYVANNVAYNNYGQGSSGQTGSGIQMAGIDGLTIEHNIAYNNGYKGGDGNIGIWCAFAKNVMMQYNESYNNISKGGRDGGGFDFDYSVSNAIMQYNYSHGNWGNGITIAHALNNGDMNNITVRYNISVNDARGPGDSSIKLWGRMDKIHIYNNTTYVTTRPSGASARSIKIHNQAAAGLYATNVYIRNNIFVATAGNTQVEMPAQMAIGSRNIYFQGNVFYTPGGSAKFSWKGTTYTGLTSFRNSTGHEKNNGVATGSDADPKLVGMGTAPTIGNTYNFKSMTAYKTQTGSSARNRAVNLSAMAVTIGSNDFWGTRLIGTSLDTGAFESGL